MKVIKKTKERILSVILTFVMVLSSMAGFVPMEVNAEVEMDPYITSEELLTDEEYNTLIRTEHITVEVTDEGIVCDLPEVQNENYKWMYMYIPYATTNENYKEAYERYVSTWKQSIGNDIVGYQIATHAPTNNQLILDVPENGIIPLSEDSYGILNIYQVYNHAFRFENLEQDTGDPDYRAYCASVILVFDVSEQGTVLNGYVDEDTSDDGGETPTPNPSVPSGDPIINLKDELGEDCISLDGNILKFDIPSEEDRGDYIYYTDYITDIGMEGFLDNMYSSYMNKLNYNTVNITGKDLVTDYEEIKANKSLIRISGPDVNESSVTMNRATYNININKKGVAVVYKLHKDNYS